MLDAILRIFGIGAGRKPASSDGRGITWDTPIEVLLRDAMSARRDLRGTFVQQYRPDPHRRWAFDFAFPGLVAQGARQNLAVECDGRMHDTAEARVRDHFRDDRTYSMGWFTLRFTGDEIRRDPDACAAGVAEALALMRGGARLPRGWRPGYPAGNGQEAGPPARRGEAETLIEAFRAHADLANRFLLRVPLGRYVPPIIFPEVRLAVDLLLHPYYDRLHDILISNGTGWYIIRFRREDVRDPATCAAQVAGALARMRSGWRPVQGSGWPNFRPGEYR